MEYNHYTLNERGILWLLGPMKALLKRAKSD